MEPASSFTWNKESEGFYSRHKLSNGQYCMVGFFRFHTKRATCYYVAFAVADKKKNLNGWFENNKNNNIEYKMTGRCGVEALLWCRDRLLEFEEFVPTRWKTRRLWSAQQTQNDFVCTKRRFPDMDIERYSWTAAGLWSKR